MANEVTEVLDGAIAYVAALHHRMTLRHFKARRKAAEKGKAPEECWESKIAAERAEYVINALRTARARIGGAA